MPVGINWTSPHTLPVIRQLLHTGVADFCEIMVDNAVHLPAEKIKAALQGAPVSLHIVASRFLEKSATELSVLAQQLRPWLAALQPIYVSDHLTQFTAADGRRLPVPTELDYENNYTHIKSRVIEWQHLLETSLLLENFASQSSNGKHQVEFFQRLMRETQADLLFDISNAYIAEYNQVAPVRSWDNLAHTTKHFHVAGFRFEKNSQRAIDTHDVAIANNVKPLIRKYVTAEKTLVVEFDANVEFELLKNEILSIKQSL